MVESNPKATATTKCRKWSKWIETGYVSKFCQMRDGGSKSWKGSCITTIYLGPRSDPAKRSLKWTLFSRNFEWKNDPYILGEANPKAKATTKCRKWSKWIETGYVSKFCQMSARWFKIMRGIMYNNYLFRSPPRSGQKILKMNTF